MKRRAPAIPKNAVAAPEAYADTHAHLRDELRKLDVLLQWHVAEFQHRHRAQAVPSVAGQGYIADAEVNHLLSLSDAGQSDCAEGDVYRAAVVKLEEEIAQRVAASQAQGVFLALPHLVHVFGLLPFEAQALVMCLAPELRRSYDTVYAYLQDDITRKKPSADLLLDVLCEREPDRWQARRWLTAQAPLLRLELLQQTDDTQSPSGSSDLARFFRLHPRVLGFLLGDTTPDASLAHALHLRAPKSAATAQAQPAELGFVEPKVRAQVQRLVRAHFASTSAQTNGSPIPPKQKLVVHVHGPGGAGGRELAAQVCDDLSCWLLTVDMRLLPTPMHEPDAERALRLVLREGLLMQAAVYLDHIEAWLGGFGAGDDARSQVGAARLAQLLDGYSSLVFLGGERAWPHRDQVQFERATFYSVGLTVPSAPLRERVWQAALSRISGLPASWARELAAAFRLTPGQIEAALQDAHLHQHMNAEPAALGLAEMYAACRRQSSHKLGELATKLEARHGWDDLVLPSDKLAQLQEICNQVQHKYQVFDNWGFEQKLSRGKGLSVLFAGPPGTGKTMAAEVMARALQLDLYKIDLSSVVSKYIGETEKNLGRIFAEAENSNAILFFDEADALFGKRTEVSDAHDRYANIETSYLLQKMEEHAGMVILATNLHDNMDEAFVRRLRFIVDFPFPDEAGRLRIWQKHFPAQAPLGADVDFAYLSRQFQLAGGNIKNIVLNAAFLAANNGSVITMKHVLHGTRREFEKTGKLWTEPHANLR